jgi:hypothetical protein
VNAARAVLDQTRQWESRTSFRLSFRLPLLAPTGAYWLDDRPELTCKDSTRQHAVDGPRLSCKQQVPGHLSAPEAQPAPLRCWCAAYLPADRGSDTGRRNAAGNWVPGGEEIVGGTILCGYAAIPTFS